MSGRKWWDKVCALTKYSFLLGEGPSVRKIPDSTGGWLERDAVFELVDTMQDEINSLQDRLDRLSPKAAKEEGK